MQNSKKESENRGKYFSYSIRSMSTTVIYKQEIDSFKLAFLLFSFIFRPNLNNFRVNTNRKM